MVLMPAGQAGFMRVTAIVLSLNAIETSSQCHEFVMHSRMRCPSVFKPKQDSRAMSRHHGLSDTAATVVQKVTISSFSQATLSLPERFSCSIPRQSQLSRVVIKPLARFVSTNRPLPMSFERAILM